ncbi:PREDICTED: flap endonuclease GEN-like 1 isoform X2 [Ipomoea nil]|uniref:flap endonuclease GEN-like 1 isoform X2 n=1 Tax=Ipomoea nil TaxID=35883 RepID=UPI00090136E9|nr:PREDICTED: flap endonuclease GEN-like 1 isoform X2 [Ipomoea nil]
MGAGGNFWDLLKPYARPEGFDFLRNKRVAVDLSYWIVQHETAIKGNTRNPHIRLTFLRTINLFSTFGAFPVFVTDGTPSPLKSQARIMRFFRSSGIDMSSLPAVEKGISVERNKAFRKHVQECVELLELLGMPVLNAKGEAEALCAQLNREGQVDACVTADSDVFLFGAKCVIKHIQPNSKEPFECYYISDIEAGLGLRRKQLIAISLLVGNDHNLPGIPGIGLETAHRFAKSFSDDEILDRLCEIRKGETPELHGIAGAEGDFVPSSEDSPRKPKLSHCSFCGHPGSKRAHLKSRCQYCSDGGGEGCKQKAPGFKCSCSSCDMDRKEKEQRKNENWHIKVCRKIALEQDFPHDLIVKIYLHNDNRVDDGCHISWTNPKTEMLVDYLAYHQHWEPSYTRKRMLPMLSTLFLRDIASNSENLLLCGQYEFDYIKRVKTRYGHQFYVVIWKKAMHTMYQESGRLDGVKDLTEDPDGFKIHFKKTGRVDELIDFPEEPGKSVHTMIDDIHTVTSENPSTHQETRRADELKDFIEEDGDGLEIHIDETGRADEVIDLTEEPDGPEIHIKDGCCYLSTDEDMELVWKAFPEKVNQFLKQKELKSRRKRRRGVPENPGSSSGIQLSITEFFRSSKGSCEAKLGENFAGSSSSSSASEKEQQERVPNFSKSARRRLFLG